MKIKRMKLFATIAIASFVFFGIFSCSEDENNGEEVNVITKSSATPENNDNPYDYIGALHNEKVHKIMNEALLKYFTINTITKSEMYQITRDVLVKDSLFSSEEAFLREVPQALLEDILSDAQNLCINKISNMGISEDVANQIAAMFNAFEIKAETSDSYADFKKIVTDMETSITSSNTLNRNDKITLLKATSIARYSLYYWFSFEDLMFKSKRPVWKYITVACADILGGVLTGNVGTAISASAFATTVIDWNEKPENPKPEVPDSTNVGNN